MSVPEMTESIFDAIPRDVLELCRRLDGHGQRGWVVGGCVRDLLRGAPAKDWDIATDARPERVQELFKRTVPTGIKHGTVTVLLHGTPYEVTTLRGEGAYEDGRHPTEVVFLDDITDDLARRDFTFNAIALDPLRRQIIDPFDGRRDLKDRILRAVGDAHTRFCEDGLRILRAARFAATLECQVDPATLEAMGAPQPLSTLAKVSVERVHDEWLKSMRAHEPSRAFALMAERRVMEVVAPELAPVTATDTWPEALAAMDAVEDPVLRIAALLHPLGAGGTDALLERLKFSNDHRKRIVAAIRHHDIAAPDALTGPNLRRWMKRVTPTHLDDVLVLAAAVLAIRTPDAADALPGLAARVKAAMEAGVPLHTRDLALRGNDLMKELSLSPGRQIGELLADLLEACLDDPGQNQRDRLLALARARLEEA